MKTVPGHGRRGAVGGVVLARLRQHSISSRFVGVGIISSDISVSNLLAVYAGS